MEKLYLRKTWETLRPKTYCKIPFEVPPQTEYIQCGGRYSGNGRVHLSIQDPEGQIRGWSGNLNTVSKVVLGEEQASLGYLSAPIQSGTWHIILGNSRQYHQTVTAEVEIELIPYQERILKGDLHGHSTHSDGSCDILEKISLSEKEGLDFLAFSDHNTISQNAWLGAHENLILLPAVEITTYYGHANLFGYSRRAIPSFLCQEPEEIREVLEQAKRDQAYIQINHPIRLNNTGGSQWDWGFDMPFDWLEIWNGTWNDSTQACLDLWQSLLASGRRIPATGNSDFHSPNPKKFHGRPRNNVSVERKTQQAILKGLAAGNNYISAGPASPQILCYRHSEERCAWAAALSVPRGTVQISGADKHMELRTWSEKGLVQTRRLNRPDTEEPFEAEPGTQFLRFELWNRDTPEIITNPIFFDRPD